jgi:hypothetical protein
MGYIQRIEERLYKEIDVNYSFVEENESESADSYHSKTININRFGLCLPLRKPVKADSIIQISIQLPHQKEGMMMLGKVIWCKQIDKDNYIAGIRFTGALPGMLSDIVEIDDQFE